jgi:hypothetical protein
MADKAQPIRPAVARTRPVRLIALGMRCSFSDATVQARESLRRRSWSQDTASQTMTPLMMAG